MLRRTCLIAAVFVMMGSLSIQADFTQDQLDAWQAIAETYYIEGVDEDFMLPLVDNPGLMHESWGFRDPNAILPGMIAPDFTLVSVQYEPVSLSQFKGNSFVVLITGSWY